MPRHKGARTTLTTGSPPLTIMYLSEAPQLIGCGSPDAVEAMPSIHRTLVQAMPSTCESLGSNSRTPWTEGVV
jgi:hypothetical protein